MQPRGYVSASNGWLYRFLCRGPARVLVAAGSVRFEKRRGDNVAEIPVSAIDSIGDRSFLFRTGLTVRTSTGTECSIGGLGRGRAEKVYEAILAEARDSIQPLSARLKELDRERCELLDGTCYVRHAAGSGFHNRLVQAVQQVCELNKLARRQLTPSIYEAYRRLARLKSLARFEAARLRANDRFVRDSVPLICVAADAVLPDTLTEEQARAIATDEDVTLVFAGAGTGKTSIILGKLVHLVQNEGVDANEILVLAYNKKAAEEIRERMPRELGGATISTFHAFGLRVVASCGVAPTISELASDRRKYRRAIDGILNALLEDPRQGDAVLRFIMFNRAPWRPAFEFGLQEEYDEYIRSVELRTLNGERVRSFEELSIANFLAEHGIEYAYEAPYPVPTATTQHRQYQPDFYLHEHDLYIEHFALDEHGNPPPGWTGYAEGVHWKRELHRRHGTSLIVTSSWQHEQDTLLRALRDELEEQGVILEPVPRETLIEKLSEQQYSWLAKLLATFLDHVKTSVLSSGELRKRACAGGDRRRNARFLDVFEQVQACYEQLLADEEKLDFHDLINRAVRHTREGRWKSRYRYVLVDEFQDISAGRMRLLEALNGQDVAYFLAGDDWQSIYRFAGSDVRLVQGCGAHLGHVQERELSQTFRFADGILRPSTAFIRRNPEQTQRALHSLSSATDRGLTIVYHKSPAEGLALALQEIETTSAGERLSVLVLGRFNFSRDALNSLQRSNSLQVEFSTVHKAKGREADYVVVLDLKDDLYGFPARIEDDPLLELVLPPVNGKAYPIAEERRLFYVAMTRARGGVWLVTDKFGPSPYVTELKRETGGLREIGESLVMACPKCLRGRLVPSRSEDNLRCTNFPCCGFLAPRCPCCKTGYAVIGDPPSAGASCTNPDCDAPLRACPKCGMGVLVKVEGHSFLGCSAFVWSEPQCRYKENIAGPDTSD